MFAGEERMLRDLTEVLLYQEIYRRRGEQRKRKQKFTVIVHCHKIYDIIIQITTKETDSEEGTDTDEK